MKKKFANDKNVFQSVSKNCQKQKKNVYINQKFQKYAVQYFSNIKYKYTQNWVVKSIICEQKWRSVRKLLSSYDNEQLKASNDLWCKEIHLISYFFNFSPNFWPIYHSDSICGNIFLKKRFFSLFNSHIQIYKCLRPQNWSLKNYQKITIFGTAQTKSFAKICLVFFMIFPVKFFCANFSFAKFFQVQINSKNLNLSLFVLF